MKTLGHGIWSFFLMESIHDCIRNPQTSGINFLLSFSSHNRCIVMPVMDETWVYRYANNLPNNFYSFIISSAVRAFILVRVKVDPEPIPETLGTWWTYTLNGMHTFGKCEKTEEPTVFGGNLHRHENNMWNSIHTVTQVQTQTRGPEAVRGRTTPPCCPK